MGSALTKAFFSGEKPDVPPLERIDFLTEQREAIQGNSANMKHLRKLGNRVNDYTTDSLLEQLERMLPGYAGIRDKITSTLGQQLSGELPDDVVRSVQQASAESAVAGGYSGSEFSRNLTARDLGLTSLQITNKALDSASRWLAQAQSGTRIFDVSSMFIHPMQRIAVKQRENEMQWQRDWLANRIDAMPEPWEAAVGEVFDSIEEMGSSVLSMYAGGAMGGGGGGSMMGMGGGGGGGVNTSSKSGGWLYDDMI